MFALDIGALLAGTRYRGDFEARFKALVHAIQQRPKAILFIDEIHTILGAGAASGGTVDASNLLKPLLQSGTLRCMGSTTYHEYRHFERDRALARRFQRVDVHEPSVEETVQILEGLRPRYEEHHEVRYAKPAIRSAAELAAQAHHRPLPARQGDRRARRGGRGGEAASGQGGAARRARSRSPTSRRRSRAWRGSRSRAPRRAIARGSRISRTI